MLPASHLISHKLTGHGPSDNIYLKPFTPSPCSSCNNHKQFPHLKISSFRSSSRGNASFICNANSNGQKRNPDFPRQNRQGGGYSRNKNRQNEIENFENSEVFSSKNGPSFLSSSSSPAPPRFQSTATPGPREREIVEIFKKVQAQLRERAAQKEEKKVEDSHVNKQNETVDSLLKLLRKHSVQHTKNTSNTTTTTTTTNNNSSSSNNYNNNNRNNNRDFVLDHQPDPVKHSVNTAAEPQSVRPVSNFQKRSPVPTRFKYRSILSGDVEPLTGPKTNEEEVTNGPKLRATPEIKLTEPGPTPEIKLTKPEVESEVFDGLDESSDDDEDSDDDEIIDSDEGNDDEIVDSDEVYSDDLNEKRDLSEMKVVELREIGKSRGLKGLSRMKKHELLELLSS